MSAEQYQSARRLAFQIVLGQLGVTLLLAVLFLLLQGFKGGYSAFLGGAIGVIASLYMATRFFAHGEGATPQEILRGVYVGEFVKLVLTVAMFVAVFKLVDVAVLALFLGYAATFFMYWVALLRAMPGS